MLSSLPKSQARPKVKELPTRTAQQKLKQTLPDVESELKLRFLNLCVVPRQEVGSKKEAVLAPALRPKALLSKLKKTLSDIKYELELRFLNFCVFPGP